MGMIRHVPEGLRGCWFRTGDGSGAGGNFIIGECFIAGWF